MKKSIAIILSCLLLLVISACGNKNEASSSSQGSDADVTPQAELVIKAKNFSFDQAEYHIKKGVPTKITLENEEGVHGVLVPGIELRLDNKHKSQVVTAEKAGSFELSCSLFCGSGHSAMLSKVVVDE